MACTGCEENIRRNSQKGKMPDRTCSCFCEIEFSVYYSKKEDHNSGRFAVKEECLECMNS